MSLIRKINHMGNLFPDFSEKGLFDFNLFNKDNLFEKIDNEINNVIDDMLSSTDEIIYPNSSFHVTSNNIDLFDKLVKLKQKRGDDVNITFNGKDIMMKDGNVMYGDDIYLTDETSEVTEEKCEDITSHDGACDDIKEIDVNENKSFNTLTEDDINNIVNSVMKKILENHEIEADVKVTNDVVDNISENCDETDNKISKIDEINYVINNSSNNELNKVCEELINNDIKDMIKDNPSLKDELYKPIDESYLNDIVEKNKEFENRVKESENSNSLETNAENRLKCVENNTNFLINGDGVKTKIFCEWFPAFNNKDVVIFSFEYPNFFHMDVCSSNFKYHRFEDGNKIGNITLILLDENDMIVDRLIFGNMVLEHKNAFTTYTEIDKPFNSRVSLYFMSQEKYDERKKERDNCKVDYNPTCGGTCSCC